MSRETDIVKNINSDTITTDDKLWALGVVCKYVNPDRITKANLLAAIEWLLEDSRPKWMRFSDRTPDEGDVLVTNGDEIWIDRIETDGEAYWWSEADIDPGITGWMPLPVGEFSK